MSHIAIAERLTSIGRFLGPFGLEIIAQTCWSMSKKRHFRRKKGEREKKTVIHCRMVANAGVLSCTKSRNYIHCASDVQSEY